MKNLILTVCTVLLSILLIQAQEGNEIEDKNSKQESLHVKLKDGANPDIYVDGKKFDFPMDLLDRNRIESITVIEDDKALRDYNAKNGVVLIVTKEKMVDEDSGSTRGGALMIIIDGEESNQDMLNKLSPDDIVSIEVKKKPEALKKNSGGIIIVTTKKGNKK